jgi:hypothetical protein
MLAARKAISRPNGIPIGNDLPDILMAAVRKIAGKTLLLSGGFSRASPHHVTTRTCFCMPILHED